MPRTRARRIRTDFHSHTLLSDGRESATSMWHHADRLDHRALAVTDHVAMEDPTRLLTQLHQEAKAFADGPLVPVIGVEVSMVPPRHVADVAKAARRAGAEIVIVHGETPVEKVPAGTNRAAIESNAVDLLAHPGFLTEEDAELAHAHDVVLELTGRRGHSLTNGLVARRAVDAGASLVVDSDAHEPSQLISLEFARSIARGAALPPSEVVRSIEDGPARLLKRLKG